MEAVVIAAIVALSAVFQLLAQGWISSRSKQEDYARQDEVAARAREAVQKVADVAASLVVVQADTVGRTDEVARLAAKNVAKVDIQLQKQGDDLKKIHILVNSDMTASRTNERDTAKLLLIALRRIKADGPSSTPEEDQAIKATEERIVELNQILADRLAAQKVVDDEATKKEIP